MLGRARTVLSEDHEIFRRSVRHFVDNELVPHHPAWEEAGIVPREVWRKAGAAGLLCCDIPADYGGAGGDFGHCAVVTEELARANLSGPGFVVHSDMVATYITRFGTEAQKRRWLPGMCDGSLIGAIAMTEPDAGSDLKGMRSRAVRDGDSYVVSGQKTYISNGQNAHLVVTAAKTDPAAGARGISLIVVETDTPGLPPRPQPEEARHAGAGHVGTVLRRCPRAGRQPARPGRPGLRHADDQSGARAPGAGGARRGGGGDGDRLDDHATPATARPLAAPSPISRIPASCWPNSLPRRRRRGR